ncbi:hypothetical protein PVK06_019857 [Gossypium arboreum]|uniref:Uncharacterized protein n=1 Tax=Gossypium arboreum TaxID=29729 RepID=A0ABR0PL70_GOSAR|nr:hypothetical protein PVK06_019857 [Gossypium arboreum]
MPRKGKQEWEEKRGRDRRGGNRGKKRWVEERGRMGGSQGLPNHQRVPAGE